jgi:hypothetical protein
MKDCPLQHSGRHYAVWKKQIKMAVDSRASGAVGTVDGQAYGNGY